VSAPEGVLPGPHDALGGIPTRPRPVRPVRRRRDDRDHRNEDLRREVGAAARADSAEGEGRDGDE
jgi:hypothetical protein